MRALARVEPSRSAPAAAMKLPAKACDDEMIRWVHRRVAFERWLDDLRDAAPRPHRSPDQSPASPLAL